MPAARPDTETLSLETLSALAERRADAAVWSDAAGDRTWREFAGLVARCAAAGREAGVRPADIVVAPGDATLEALAWIFGLAALGAVVAPLRAARAGEIEGWKCFARLHWRVRGENVVRIPGGAQPQQKAAQLLADLQARRRPGLILATGGTTGTPKLVLHELGALLATVRVKDSAPRRLLPLMRFDHIGGLDMAWRALAGGHVLVAPPAELSPEAVAAVVAAQRVDVLPATPSFLNLLVASGALERHDFTSLRTVPYGAEPMPIGLLGRLRAALPRVEFVQRFGTSETGALPVVELGAGLCLGDDAAGFTWKIVEDELWVRSPARALGYLAGDNGALDSSGWFRTGDLAEKLPDGSVRVLGRLRELINVGGEKVLPAEVEGVLAAHPLVADCRVSAAPSALLGQVVAAEIVWRGPETDAVAVKRALHEFAAERLPRHKLPAAVRLVGAVTTTANLKKERS